MPEHSLAKTQQRHCLSVCRCQTLFQQDNQANTRPQQEGGVSSPFFWSLDTVIVTVAISLGEIILREQIRDLPFTVKHNGAVHGLAPSLILHIYLITAVLTGSDIKIYDL